MNNENLMELRELRKEEKVLKANINAVKEDAILEAQAIVPSGGTFDIEGAGRYILKVETGYDLTNETGKYAKAWQKKKKRMDELQEQINDLRAQQAILREKMANDGANHVSATRGTERAYQPIISYTIVVL